jgi:tight adherence protein C
MMFTVPPLLIILVGPSVVGMMEAFSSGGVAP